MAHLSSTRIDPDPPTTPRDWSYLWDLLGGLGAVLVIAAGFVLHLAAGLGLLGLAFIGAAWFGARESARRQEEKRQ